MHSRFAALAALAALANAAALPASADVQFRDDALEKNGDLAAYLTPLENLFAGQTDSNLRSAHGKSHPNTLSFPGSDKPSKKHHGAHHVPGQHHRDDRLESASNHKKHKSKHPSKHNKDKRDHDHDHDHDDHDHHHHGHHDHNHDEHHHHDHDHDHDRRVALDDSDLDIEQFDDGISYADMTQTEDVGKRGLLEDLLFGYHINYGSAYVDGHKDNSRIRVGKPSSSSGSSSSSDDGLLGLHLSINLRDFEHSAADQGRHFMHHDFDKHVDISRRADPAPPKDVMPGGIPGQVDIVGSQPGQAEASKFASMVLTPASPKDGTGAPFVLNASSANSSTVYMVRDTEMPSSSSFEFPVLLKFIVFDPANVALVPYCATFDPNPPKPAPMFVQSCSSVVEGPHMSQRFAYNLYSRVLRPMYLTNATTASPSAPTDAPAAPAAPAAPHPTKRDAAAPAAPSPQSVTMVFAPMVENILPQPKPTTAFLPSDNPLPLSNISDAVTSASSLAPAPAAPAAVTSASSSVPAAPAAPATPPLSMFTGPGDSFAPTAATASVVSATGIASSVGPIFTAGSVDPLSAATGIVPDPGNDSVPAPSTVSEAMTTHASPLAQVTGIPSPTQLMYETYL